MYYNITKNTNKKTSCIRAFFVYKKIERHTPLLERQ